MKVFMTNPETLAQVSVACPYVTACALLCVFIFLPNSSGVNFKVRTGATNDFNEGSGLFGS